MPTLAEVAALREQVVHADAELLDATAAGWVRAAEVATHAARVDGSTVVGQTARDQPLNADALIFAGSPGVGVEHVEGLHRPPGTVYSTTSDADIIGWTHSPLIGVFDDELGRDPSAPEFGAHVFHADPAGDHGAYWNTGNPSLRSFGLIAVGKEPDS
jgi:hypothetical protein